MRTWRWAGYLAIAVIFALVCGGLALWQFDRGRGASADNQLYTSNFAMAATPLTEALPTLSSYSQDQVWRAVSLHGRWDGAHQYYLRNSVRSGETGYDVITAFRLDSGDAFLVNRGWVAATDNGSEPSSRPAPPSGSIALVARLQPSQAKRGEGGVSAHQIESVDLSELAPVVGGAVYSSAWGVIVSPRASADGLARIQASPPAEGVGYHYSYMIQWIAFALIGFFLLWRGAVREFRRINADDPDEQRREAERVRKRAGKSFTDEEIEDESLDGFIPLSRWTGRPGLPLGAASGPAKPALTGTPISFDAADDEAEAVADEDAPQQDGQVYVLESRGTGAAASDPQIRQSRTPQVGDATRADDAVRSDDAVRIEDTDR
nr:SURF1 family cytochrome oxidase biogenesis protein [Planctomonas sp. JC2975]